MSLADQIIEHEPFAGDGIGDFSGTAAELNELRDELIAARALKELLAGTRFQIHPPTYEEWRVTGTLAGGSPRAWRWSPKNGDKDPEGSARRFMSQLGGWTDGPHLHKRTVTVTDWEEA